MTVKIVTQSTVSKLAAARSDGRIELPIGSRLTDLAKEYIASRGLTLIVQGEKGAKGTTDLRPGVRVPKCDTQIRFRARLDSFVALLLEIEVNFGSQLAGSAARGLKTLLVRIMKAHLGPTGTIEWDFLGLGLEQAHALSHRPAALGVRNHLDLLEIREPGLIALNRMRSQVRELELIAWEAESEDPSEFWDRTTYLLNRASSLVYVLMLIESKEGTMDEEELRSLIENVIQRIKTEKKRPEELLQGQLLVPVEISARHVHLSREDALLLFPEGLQEKRELSQPGQYLAAQRVSLIGPKGMLSHVAVLGPERTHTQVEISKTDAFTLGVDAPVRQSGDTDRSAPISISNGKKMLTVDQGCIVAARHIHLDPESAEGFGIRDGQVADVQIDSQRPVLFQKVLIRVDAAFRPAFHLDTDESNGAGITAQTVGRIIL